MSFTFTSSTVASADSFTMLIVYFAVFPVSDVIVTANLVVCAVVATVLLAFPVPVTSSIVTWAPWLFAITATSDSSISAPI